MLDQVTQFDRFKPPHSSTGLDLKVTSLVETNHMTKGKFFRFCVTSVSYGLCDAGLITAAPKLGNEKGC